MATDETLREALDHVTEECITLCVALHTVLSESDDPESVRVSIAGLMGTEHGRAYYDMHPLRI